MIVKLVIDDFNDRTLTLAVISCWQLSTSYIWAFFLIRGPCQAGYFPFSFFKFDMLPHGLLTRLEILTTT